MIDQVVLAGYVIGLGKSEQGGDRRSVLKMAKL